MGTVISIILDVLAILAIIVFGALIVVVVADLILCLFDGHQGVIFRRNKEEVVEEEKKTTVQKSDDIVVYKDKKIEDKEVVAASTNQPKSNAQEVDFDKAAEEQEMLNAKKQQAVSPAPAPAPERKRPTPPPQPPKKNVFDDISVDDDFSEFLADVIKEAKKEDKPVQKEEVKVDAKKEKDEETKKELEELRKLKEEQQKELDEFRKLKEDFAREKEEQLALMKGNLDKAKEEEIERIKQEAIREQEKLEKEQEKLEREQEKLENEKARLEEEQQRFAEEKRNKAENSEENTIVKETIIKDEEELNKLKYKNLMRMNARLTRLIRDTEKLQAEKHKKLEKQEQERQRALEREAEEKAREQERQVEMQNKNREMLAKQQEALRKQEIEQKLANARMSAGKYSLNSRTVTITKEQPEIETKVLDDSDDDDVKKNSKELAIPMRSANKPLLDKEYYETRLQELDEELREAEKELRQNKSEYIPLTRIHKAYVRDSEKLRKKEMQVAKQKVALYGVNSSKAKSDPAKKEKLDENLQALSELKDSVQHCEEVIRKNKDRYPVLEKNNKLIVRHIERINEDIRVCEKAIAYHNKNK